MTRRLYFEDSHLKAFDATVLAARSAQDGLWLRLDRSAFYPTGGGQPHDTGTLTGGGATVRVLNVETDREGEVWHRVDGPLAPGTPVSGAVDWPRRLDHMQQHCGEHLLAGALFELFGAFTVGLHIGREFSTIDVQMPDGRLRLAREEVARAEDLANARVWENVPVRCWFPSPGELKDLPLRKDPAHEGRLRVVAMGSFEAVACGGTHPAATGQCGPIHVLGTEPVRGKMRVRFVCGLRAVRRCRALGEAAGEASRLLSLEPERLPEGILRLLSERDSLRREAQALQGRWLDERLRFLLRDAPALPDGTRLLRADLPGADPRPLREAASRLVEGGRVIALLGSPGDRGCRFVFARSEQLPADMAALLKAAGIRGGGSPSFAEGFAGDADPGDLAAGMLLSPQPAARRLPTQAP